MVRWKGINLLKRNTRGNGSIIKCTIEESIHRKTVVGMKGNINTIRKMDLENIFGLTAEGTKGFGKMENSMERDSTISLTVLRK